MPGGSAALSEMELPPLPLEEWEDTKETLHRYCQIVGKTRMELSPFRNHWWHVTLYVSPRGLTTGPIPYAAGVFEATLDLLESRLVVTTSENTGFDFFIEDLPVGEFYSRFFAGLESAGIEASINATPFDLDDDHALDANFVHDNCVPSHVQRYHRVLLWTDQVFKEFAGRFNGKQSPVQLFWHSFDLALNRFSGRRATLPEGADPVTREAYSHEVISFGFWPGDARVREPAFYSYTAPEPDDLTDQPLGVEAASWQEGGTALLPYEAVRDSGSPKDTLLDFMQNAYLAGAKTANWDIEDFGTQPTR
jgi:hypothetical protein